MVYPGNPFSILETVAIDTPAFFATSLIVGLILTFSPLLPERVSVYAYGLLQRTPMLSRNICELARSVLIEAREAI